MSRELGAADWSAGREVARVLSRHQVDVVHWPRFEGRCLRPARRRFARQRCHTPWRQPALLAVDPRRLRLSEPRTHPRHPHRSLPLRKPLWPECLRHQGVQAEGAGPSRSQRRQRGRVRAGSPASRRHRPAVHRRIAPPEGRRHPDPGDCASSSARSTCHGHHRRDGPGRRSLPSTGIGRGPRRPCHLPGAMPARDAFGRGRLLVISPSRAESLPMSCSRPARQACRCWERPSVASPRSSDPMLIGSCRPAVTGRWRRRSGTRSTTGTRRSSLAARLRERVQAGISCGRP